MPTDPNTEASASKPPIYLLDSMAFIFRAYHAMQRQRPMSTRTGIPTAATYVFVNMINKLRKDFAPQYLAAVYDLSGPVFRDQRAREMKPLRKWNVKTQQFEQVDYAGYKANRAEMPADLTQQLPYIRRALEAFRIPILSYEGFEADDVIGALSHKLSALGHRVFVVSSDKDMMQLVTSSVSILNPTKDNLVLDPAGVEAALGVPPERVIDVMALRGDSIDNIPGAPGIGDKGSVELIQQFGTVEAALDAATAAPDSIKRKTYRESLANNRDNILLSKELVTIHTEVPIEFSVDDMRTQPVDNTACRDLFSEPEFTTLLKELAPAAQHRLRLQPPARRPRNRRPPRRRPHRQHRSGAPFIAQRWVGWKRFGHRHLRRRPRHRRRNRSRTRSRIRRTRTSARRNHGPLRPTAVLASPRIPGAPFIASDGWGANTLPAPDPACRLGLAIDGASAIEVSLDAPGIRAALEDATLPKLVHDLKAVLRALAPHNVTLRGVETDVMLQSYLVNPTHASHTLPDIAARSTNRALEHQPTKANPNDPKRLAEAAAAIVRLATVFATQIAESDATAAAPTLSSGPVQSAPLQHIYQTMDLPLVPVLLRMEQAGVRIDPAILSSMSTRLAVEMDTLADRIYSESGNRFNINSPKQLGDVLFNKMQLPKPQKYGKGKVISTAQDVLEELAEHHPVPALVLEYRQLAKLRSTYLDSLPNLVDAEGRVHTTFNQVGTATGRLSSTNPNLQNIPVRTALGREIRAAFIPAPGNLLMSADYSQIELRLMAHFSQDPLLLDAYRTGKDIHTLTASEVFGIPVAELDKETRNRAKAVNFGIVYGISPFGLAAQLGIDQREASPTSRPTSSATPASAASSTRPSKPSAASRPSAPTSAASAPSPTSSRATPTCAASPNAPPSTRPLQGTAADLIKLAMIRIDAEIAATQAALAHDPTGPRRTPLRRPPGRSRRTPRPGPARDGTRRRIQRPHRRRSRPRPQLARHQIDRTLLR